MTSGSIGGRPGVAERRVVALPLRGVRTAWARPELLPALAVAAALNLWGLSRNGWANTFYAGAVRSMASSWHDFLFASLDRSGLMTVDKPPLALWIQALSVRIFGWHSLSILVPQALMGVATVGLTYDLVRRRFGRAAGFAAALVLALTPMTVAISRHNNPDQALILCCVAALWFAVRALEDGRTRWLVWSGVCVGLGFEAKMSVALFVVPGIAIAWLWTAPVGGWLTGVCRLAWGGLAMTAVGLAWPLLVTLTPAADRPWISGTSDNSIWSLILNYNGVGRVTGQAGAPATGGGGGFSSGATGPFRLLDSALGGQAGWLLGFAVVSALGIVVLARLRRSDARSGWLIAVGGAFVVSAVVFSVSSGIVHPYYVSFLAPWAAMLVGAGVGEALRPGLPARALAAAAIIGGAVTELAVLGQINGSVGWATPLVIVICSASVLVLLVAASSSRLRAVAVAVALAALLAAPATWAVDTLGHATSSTFPAGGPASAGIGGGPGGGFAGFGGGGRGGAGGPRLAGSSRPGAGGSVGSGAGVGSGGGFGSGGGVGSGGGFGSGGGVGSGGRFGSGGGFGSGGTAGSGGSNRGPAGGSAGFGGGMFGGDSATVKAASKYAASHGGGTVAVESQSSAAAAIVGGQRNVAGIGGFSGRESTVTASWLAMEVRDGHLRWILPSTGGAGGGFGGSGGRFGGGTRGGSAITSLFGAGSTRPGSAGAAGAGGGGAGTADGRTGSERVFQIAEKVGRKVALKVDGQTVTMYDLKGKAAAILAAAKST